MVDGWIGHAAVAAVSTCRFFLEPARSIWDEARYEFLAEQLGKFLGADGFSWGGDACRNAAFLSSILWGLRGPWLRRHHYSCNAGHIEVHLGLVVGRPGNTVLVGGLRHRHLVDRDATQHLVFDLHGIVRIEELAAPKLWIAHLLEVSAKASFVARCDRWNS